MLWGTLKLMTLLIPSRWWHTEVKTSICPSISAPSIYSHRALPLHNLYTPTPLPTIIHIHRFNTRQFNFMFVYIQPHYKTKVLHVYTGSPQNQTQKQRMCWLYGYNYVKKHSLNPPKTYSTYIEVYSIEVYRSQLEGDLGSRDVLNTLKIDGALQVNGVGTSIGWVF